MERQRILVYSPDTDGETWSSRILLEVRRPRIFHLKTLSWQGNLYTPGRVWTRIDADTLETETLSPTPLPRCWWSGFHGVSAHYGPVTWFPTDSLYQVQIHPEPVTSAPESEFDMIPETHRQQHMDAVAAIRRQGGSVDTTYQPDPMTVRVTPDLDASLWKTTVYLGPDWRGGDAGLAALVDLFHFDRLSLVQTPVTDAGMVHVAGTESLSKLSLVDTAITDAGLQQLTKLSRLEILRLDAPAGTKHFTAAGLASLGQIPLRILTITGPGFTDDAIEPLTSFTQLRQVHAVNTDITREAKSSLRINRRAVIWIRFPYKH